MTQWMYTRRMLPSIQLTKPQIYFIQSMGPVKASITLSTQVTHLVPISTRIARKSFIRVHWKHKLCDVKARGKNLPVYFLWEFTIILGCIFGAIKNITTKSFLIAYKNHWRNLCAKFQLFRYWRSKVMNLWLPLLMSR